MGAGEKVDSRLLQEGPDESYGGVNGQEEMVDVSSMPDVAVAQSTMSKCWDITRYLYSTFIVGFAVAILIELVLNQSTNIYTWGNMVPAGGIILLVVLQFFLAILEGSQAAIVGLGPIDPDVYADSHKLTAKLCGLCHKPGALDRYIVGRQFLVVFVVFIISAILGPDMDEIDENPFGMPGWFVEVFLTTGLLGALVTIVFGQLITAAVIAPNSKIDFLDNVICGFATVLSLAVEWAGLMHSVYVMGNLFKWIASTKDTDTDTDTSQSDDDDKLQNTKEAEEESKLSKAWWWFRATFSAVLLGFAVAVVINCLFKQLTNLYDEVPPVAAFFLFLFFLVFNATLEGLQIALFTIYEIPRSQYKQLYPRAYANCSLLFGNGGKNLMAFLIGRQILVTLLMFFLSMVCTVNEGKTLEVDVYVFGLAEWVHEAFMITGLLGAIITTILGSLLGRVIATASPLGFCNAPGMGIIIWMCMALEFTGITHVAWPLAWGIRWLLGKLRGWKDDGHYVAKHKAEE